MRDPAFIRESGVPRRRLLERLRAARPRLVAVVAPAGFGKTTLAEQFASGWQVCSRCDCSGVRDEFDLARRVLAALSIEEPGRIADLTRLQLLVSPSVEGPERWALALRAWQVAARPAAFVFDNVEAAVALPDVRERFLELLANIPSSRVVVFCSRVAVPAKLSRFVLPHEIAHVGPAELAFDETETAELMGDAFARGASFARVAALSQGWAIVLALFARFSREERLEGLLDRLTDVAFADLHDYLAEEVLGRLDAAQLRVLEACALLPDARQSDIELATDDGDVREALDRLMRQTPFVRRKADGTFAVHPLVRATLGTLFSAARGEMLRTVARRWSEDGDRVRAAQLYAELDDLEAAARELAGVEFVERQVIDARAACLLGRFDRELVMRHPRLWLLGQLLSKYTRDEREVMREADELWERLPADASALVRFYIFSPMASIRSDLGRHEEARALVDAFMARIGIRGEPQNVFEAIAFMLACQIEWRQGRVAPSDSWIAVYERFAPRSEFFDAEASIRMAVYVHRVRGERGAERALLEHALDISARSGLPHVRPYALAEAAIGAWLAGEDEAFSAYSEQLLREVESGGFVHFAYLAAQLNGTTEKTRAAVALPEHRCAGHLVACANARDDGEARRQADAALAAADEFRSPFLQTLAGMAVASCAPGHRGKALKSLRVKASAVEVPALQDAVAQWCAGDSACGMLAAFARRLERHGEGERPAAEIRFCSGEIRIGGRPVALRGRQRELLFFVARHRRPSREEELCDALWPNADVRRAQGALRVSLHRLRGELGGVDLVLKTDGGYRLRSDATVDLWNFEDLRRRRDVATLRSLHATLACELPAFANAWEWFAPIERHVNEVRREVALGLAAAHLSLRDWSAAARLAAEVSRYDPFDEQAREIAIRAHLAAGDRTAALREYRRYREMLARELDIAPSPALTDLMHAAAKS